MKKLSNTLYDAWLEGKLFGFTTLKLKVINSLWGKKFNNKHSIEMLTSQLRTQRSLAKEYRGKYYTLHKEVNTYIAVYGELPKEVAFEELN